MGVGLTVNLIGTSFGSSAVASGGALEAAGLESLDTAGCISGAGGASDFGPPPAADGAGVDAEVAGELGPVVVAGAAEGGVPSAGFADAGAGDDGVGVESAGCLLYTSDAADE